MNTLNTVCTMYTLWIAHLRTNAWRSSLCGKPHPDRTSPRWVLLAAAILGPQDRANPGLESPRHFQLLFVPAGTAHRKPDITSETN